jgi:hypothetical protein
MRKFMATESLFRDSVFEQEPPFVGFLTPIDPGIAGVVIGGALAASGIFKIRAGLLGGARAGGGLLSTAKRIIGGVLEGAADLLTGGVAVASAIRGGGLKGPIFFQYFPESFNDSRDLDYEQVRVPLFTSPIPTLSNASPRNISLEVWFSQDKWEGPGIRLREWDKYNFDVGTALQAIRAFVYPIGLGEGIASVGALPQPLLLTLPNTRIGINSDTIACLMTSYSITYHSFFPDGQPRVASAELSFIEIFLPLAHEASSRNITTRDFTKIYEQYVNQQEKVISSRIDRQGKTLKLKSF